MPDNVVDLQGATHRRRSRLRKVEGSGRAFKFEWHDHLIRQGASLTFTQYRMLDALFAAAAPDGGDIRPSRQELAQMVGVSLRTVERTLPLLIKLEWIVCEVKGTRLGQRGLNSRYRLRIPDRHLLP
jgi:hypothetical protein